MLLYSRIVSPGSGVQLSQPHRNGWPVDRSQREEEREEERGGLPTDLVDGQVDARVGNDAQQVGQVAVVEGTGPFSLHDPPRTVQQPLVLARPAKGQPCL